MIVKLVWLFLLLPKVNFVVINDIYPVFVAAAPAAPVALVVIAVVVVAAAAKSNLCCYCVVALVVVAPAANIVGGAFFVSYLLNQFRPFPPPHSRRRFSMVDVQNATLSGGVAVGAVADLRMQPVGAMAAGSAAAAVATYGFR